MIYVNDSSRVWHVAKAGNDGNSGHAGQYPVNLASDAKLTITAAVSAAADGDTIVIWPGTYDEAINSSAKALTFIGTHRGLSKISRSSGYAATLEIGSYTSVRNLTVQAVNPNIAVKTSSGKTNLSFERCNFIGTYDGLNIYGAQHVFIRDCYIKGTYDAVNFGSVSDLVCEHSVFETDGSYDGYGDFRAVHVGPGTYSFKNCIFLGGPRTISKGAQGAFDLNMGMSSAPTLVTCENCVFKAQGTVTGTVFGIRVQNSGRLSLSNCSVWTSGTGSLTTDLLQTGSGVFVVSNSVYNTTSGVITQADSGWPNALAGALFTNGAANKLLIDTAGRVDAGSIKGVDGDALIQAIKVLKNKAVQDKLTGEIRYYDDDGETVILTHTPDEDESSFTRTVS